VDVVDDLRVPDVMDFIDCQLRFDLRKGVPVAIVIVADVLVIKLGRLGAFVRRAESFVVPIFDDVDAVRIQAGYKQNDRILENVLYLRLVAGCQTMRDQHRRQRRANLC